MTVQYSVDCFNSKIMVQRVEDGGGQFNVNIQSNSNPLGFGNTIISASTEEQAVRIADQLCLLYELARENGYILQGKTFVKPDVASICVEEVLMRERSRDELAALLTDS